MCRGIVDRMCRGVVGTRYILKGIMKRIFLKEFLNWILTFLVGSVLLSLGWASRPGVGPRSLDSEADVFVLGHGMTGGYIIGFLTCRYM